VGRALLLVVALGTGVFAAQEPIRPADSRQRRLAAADFPRITTNYNRDFRFDVEPQPNRAFITKFTKDIRRFSPPTLPG